MYVIYIIVMKKVCILFGSQHGNSESIASNLEDKMQSLYDVTCKNLNSLRDEEIIEFSLIVIICSTTGNGDAPDNANIFWRKIKNRSIDKKLFLNLNYAVLGIGDTNFNYFCNMGKLIDKRLFELGGLRSLPLYCFDDATQTEQDIESWEKLILSNINSL
jgi:methionine synthase reductase